VNYRGSQRVCSTSYLDTSLRSAFPESLSMFNYVGKTLIGNETGNVFNWNDMKNANLNYTFITTDSGVPLQYLYIGFSSPSFLSSPNYDWFVMNYTKFVPGPFNQSVLALPSDCQPGNAISHTERLSHLFHFDEETLFNEFVSEHKKEYNSEEEKQARKKIFLTNLEKIINHRWEFNLGLKKHVLALNHLADKTEEEVTGCYQSRPKKEKEEYHQITGKSVPSFVDWRTKGAVSPLKDQGDCGSCWSFSSTGSAESLHYLKYGKMEYLSEQYLVSCSLESSGCQGGEPSQSYDFVSRTNGGIWPSEENFPYRMQNIRCVLGRNGTVVIKGYKKISEFDQSALEDAVANVGPISICICTKGWTFYHSGVFDDSVCNFYELDHCAGLVGYGTDEKTGEDYWLIRNSWSKYWGEAGFMRISRGHNRCGVETTPIYPIIG